MFAPVAGTPSGPALAPIFSEFDETAGLTPFLEDRRAANQTTQAAMLAMIFNLSVEAVVDSDLGRNCALMFGSGVAVLLNTAKDATGEDVPPNDRLVHTMAVGQMVNSVKWICDLVNASKKKELTGDNVEGYYASLARTDVKGAPIASLINQIANFLPDMVSDDIFRGNLTESVWNEYHISRVSTGKLLFGIRDAFLDLEIYASGDTTDQAIIASKDAPYNIQLSYDIPNKIVGYASLFFQAAGKDVGKWWQGEKAEDEIPAAKLKSIKKVFKKYLEITGDAGQIDGAVTLEGLNSAVKDGFW
jgi:hypothetical protein